MNKVYEYKLVKKSEFVYYIKDGAKIQTKIMMVSDGWHDGCTIRNTLEDATERARQSLENRLCAFGGDFTVTIK
jgi:hypothetical protein